MAHNIDSMMYFGQEPWHGLGTALERPATAAEAIKAAGLDWSVAKVPMFAHHSKGVTMVSDHFAVMREDRMVGGDAVILGVVGTQYEPIQNRDAFRFFDPIVGKDAAVYHTAGSLGNGERIWILAKLPGEIRVIGDDITHKYLLLTNSHDGSSAAGVMFTPIRVVCQNTLNAALDGNRLHRIIHTARGKNDLDRLHEAIGFISDGYKSIEAACQHMAKVPLSSERLAEYLDRVMPVPQSDDRKRNKILAARRESTRLFETGRGADLPGVKGTLWAAYNGIVEYADSHMVLTAKTQADRLRRIRYGDAAGLKIRAYEAAVAVAKGSSN